MGLLGRWSAYAILWPADRLTPRSFGTSYWLTQLLQKPSVWKIFPVGNLCRNILLWIVVTCFSIFRGYSQALVWFLPETSRPVLRHRGKPGGSFFGCSRLVKPPCKCTDAPHNVYIYICIYIYFYMYIAETQLPPGSTLGLSFISWADRGPCEVGWAGGTTMHATCWIAIHYKSVKCLQTGTYRMLIWKDGKMEAQAANQATSDSLQKQLSKRMDLYKTAAMSRNASAYGPYCAQSRRAAQAFSPWQPRSAQNPSLEVSNRGGIVGWASKYTVSLVILLGASDNLSIGHESTCRSATRSCPNAQDSRCRQATWTTTP